MRVDHSAVCVRDMERSVAFYRDVIGMEKVFDRQFDEKMARVLGLPAAQVRVVHMKLGDSAIELFEYHEPAGREPTCAHEQWEFGNTHLGLRVENFWEVYEHLRRQGVQFLGDGVEFRPGVFVAYFRGPDGEVCEIREILPTA